MKQVRLPARSISFLAFTFWALLVGLAPHSLSAREGNAGRLVIRRSPLLGSNVVVAVTIDGKPAGSITHGRTFETELTPGSHTLSASPGSGENPWRGTLSVQAGGTYTFSASYTVNQLQLTAVAASR